MSVRRKAYTIEQSPAGHRAHPEAGNAHSGGSVERGSPGVVDVLVKLEELGSLIQPAQAVVSNVAEAYRREIIEVMKLREELRLIQHAITQTKREVVSLHAGGFRTVTVNHAAGELGAVVLDTEGATNAILAAAEQIEMLAGVIQSEKTAASMKVHAGEIAAMVLGIYESCNFQDLTGQRINRVCETLNFVETRVGRMAEIWGGLDSLSAIMASEIEALRDEQMALGTHGLAAGPALVGADGHVGQDEIDALFQ